MHFVHIWRHFFTWHSPYDGQVWFEASFPVLWQVLFFSLLVCMLLFQDDMVYIFGKDKTKGTLTLVDSLQLDGCPVQMESISGQEVIFSKLQIRHFFQWKSIDIFSYFYRKKYVVVLIRIASLRHFKWVPTTCFLGEIRKFYLNTPFCLELFFFFLFFFFFLILTQWLMALSLFIGLNIFKTIKKKHY